MYFLITFLFSVNWDFPKLGGVGAGYASGDHLLVYSFNRITSRI